MISEPTRLGEISIDFANIPSRSENCPYKHAQVGQPGKWDRVFFNYFFLFRY